MIKKIFLMFVMAVGYSCTAWAGWPHVGGEHNAKATHLLAKKS